MDGLFTPLGCHVTLDRVYGHPANLPPIRLTAVMPRGDGRWVEILLSERNLAELLARAAQVLTEGG